VLRDGKTLDIPVTLSELPKDVRRDGARLLAEGGAGDARPGVRDAYSRHIPQETKGVMVALVKQARRRRWSNAHARRAGHYEVDDQPVRASSSSWRS